MATQTALVDKTIQPAPRRLMLEVLHDWHTDWPARPTAVVYVESARRPQLTRDLAEGLARFLKLPIIGRWRRCPRWYDS